MEASGPAPPVALPPVPPVVLPPAPPLAAPPLPPGAPPLGVPPVLGPAALPPLARTSPPTPGAAPPVPVAPPELCPPAPGIPPVNPTPPEPPPPGAPSEQAVSSRKGEIVRAVKANLLVRIQVIPCGERSILPLRGSAPGVHRLFERIGTGSWSAVEWKHILHRCIPGTLPEGTLEPFLLRYCSPDAKFLCPGMRQAGPASGHVRPSNQRNDPPRGADRRGGAGHFTG